MAGPILQQVLGAGLGSSDSTAVRRGLAELLQAEWGRRPELRDSLLRAPLLHLLTDPDGEGRSGHCFTRHQTSIMHTRAHHMLCCNIHTSLSSCAGTIRLDAQQWWDAMLPQELPERMQALLSPAQTPAGVPRNPALWTCADASIQMTMCHAACSTDADSLTMHHVRPRLWCHTSLQQVCRGISWRSTGPAPQQNSCCACRAMTVTRTHPSSAPAWQNASSKTTRSTPTSRCVNCMLLRDWLLSFLASLPKMTSVIRHLSGWTGTAGHAANGAHVFSHLVSVTDFLSVGGVTSVTVCGGPWRHACQPHTGDADTIRTCI
jgi:hypothetical protein